MSDPQRGSLELVIGKVCVRLHISMVASLDRKELLYVYVGEIDDLDIIDQTTCFQPMTHDHLVISYYLHISLFPYMSNNMQTMFIHM